MRKELSGWLWIPGTPKNHYYGAHPNGWNWPLCGNGNAVIPVPVANSPWGKPQVRSEDDPDNCKLCLRLLKGRAGRKGADRQ